MTIPKLIRPTGWTSLGPYSPAVVIDDVIYISGQVPVDPSTGATVGTSIRSQLTQVFANLSRVLAEAGSDRDHVICTKLYFVVGEDLAFINEAYEAFFVNHQPARTSVCVPAFGRPDLLVEIDAVATKKAEATA